MTAPRKPIVLPPGAGRSYPMGRISAVFKADETETANAYSISEWWLEPNCTGPGPHSHPEDDVFFILEGTMSVFLGDHWIDAPAGTFVLIPGGVTHDFQNRSDKRAGLLDFTNGVFEPEMPGISQWFIENPPGPAR
jgi:mannose-6-phosphate isomerase-like protein (cupin superfamily)